ncbi:MAG TPA: DUF6371 domain-containing protein [Puia sp.]
MNGHRYILEPYKGPASRVRCPACGKPREFSRYLDQETGDLLPDHVGRCNREESCGYHYTPAQHYEATRPLYGGGGTPKRTDPSPKRSDPAQQVDYLPIDLVSRTMAGHNRNYFILYLRSLFGRSATDALIQRYLIGTSKHWNGSTVFWQIDQTEQVRQAKVMLYNPSTGRRVKDDNGSKVFFAGKSLLQNHDANLLQCLFGEHLLAEHPAGWVGIVESEKTAIIASIYFPNLIWLATGGKNGARWTDPAVCRVLRGREVILFPDLNVYQKWKEKAHEIQLAVSCKISVSDLLETIATDEQRTAGWDLADYLVKRAEPAGWAVTDEGYPVMWDYATNTNQ